MKTVFGKVAGTCALFTTLGLSAQTWNPVQWHAAASDTASAVFYKTLLPTVEEAVSAGKFDPSLFTEVKGLDNVKPTESVRVYFVSGEKGPDAWKGYRALFTGEGSLLGGEYTYSEGESKVRSGDFAEFAGSEKAAYQEGGFAAAGGGTGAEWFGTIKGSSSYNASVYEIAGTGLSLLSFNLNGASMALVFSTDAITTPEPGTYAIMAGCLGLGVWMTRRRYAPSKA